MKAFFNCPNLEEVQCEEGAKKFCEREYWNLVGWWNSERVERWKSEIVERWNCGVLPALPSWEVARKWPGHIIGTIDYAVKSAAECTQEELGDRQFWDEGYGCWWHLANPKLLNEPIPCRGNVGMWRMEGE